jgi:class 3 adenylate cyclase
MTDEERADPTILMADIVNVKEKLPRTQRLARAASLTEREVALFMAEFEAMRRSTQRIASGACFHRPTGTPDDPPPLGEDEDDVNDSIGSSNRAARRQAKAALAKGKKV